MSKLKQIWSLYSGIVTGDFVLNRAKTEKGRNGVWVILCSIPLLFVAGFAFYYSHTENWEAVVNTSQSTRNVQLIGFLLMGLAGIGLRWYQSHRSRVERD